MAISFEDFNMKMLAKGNPFLSSFSSYLPTKITDIFKWSEFIINNVPIAAAGVKKISEVVVTNFKYNTEGDSNETSLILRDSWKNILENQIGLKEKLLDISYNLEVYGNVFISVYKPFERMLECQECKKMTQISHVSKVKFKLYKDTDFGGFNSNEFETSQGEEELSNQHLKGMGRKKTKPKVIATAICGKCKKETVHYVIDMPITEHKKINIINWNPNSIKIEFNPITGQAQYYYSPEQKLINAIKENSKFFLSGTPLEIIETILLNKIFKFEEEQIYHAKKNVTMGVSTVWGIPKLVSAIPTVMSYLIYNKANEKIAMDYMVPLRVMFPSAQQGDMFNFMGGDTTISKMNDIVTKWKIDPSGIQMTPFPIGTQQILGDGKMLNLEGELQQKEVSIANALGVPIEFIKGGLSYSSQGPSLRLLENQMAKSKYGLDRIIEFIVLKISNIIGKEAINVSLLPFKMIDDLQEKATIIQLATQGGGLVSKETLMELFNFDSNTEKERIIQESKNQVKSQMELQRYQQEVQTSLEEKARSEQIANQSSFNQLNTQALMDEANSYVQQLSQMDDGARKSQLDELSKTNYILYATVKALLDMENRKQMYQAANQQQQQ